jgi:hypothetical protein
MSRLTGTDAKNLMEAYSEVYAPQEELTEEQIWEEVENWVNSLVEEGYDLSEYTWEELYESYIEEQGGRSGRGTGGGAEATSREVGAINRALGSAASAVGQSLQRANTVPSARPAGARQNLRGGGSRPVTSAAPQRQGPPVPPRLQQKPSAPAPRAAAPAAPARPAPAPRAASPAARPAAAPARPATPAAGTQKPAPASTPAAPARPSLSSQADEIRKMRASSLQRQGKPLDAATVSASTKPAFQANSFDPFDVVIGHLLDEGYADTEEAALAIMTNMSEEWRESIVEEVLTEKLKKGTKGVQFGSGKHSGGFDQAMTEKNPKTGRQRATSPMLKAMGAHGRARSAQASAEREGDFPRAERNRQRREKIAATVYRKTNKIIDRADND